MSAAAAWAELTPGAVARLALHSDPAETADALRVWAGGEPEIVSGISTWFAIVSDQLRESA